jgi:GTP-binding protein
VGKSSLLNMIARQRLAIVDPTPGVTRDRVSIVVDLDPPDAQGPVLPVELTDTGGYGVYVAEGARYNDIGADLATLTDDIEFQIAQAVAGADMILFAVDAQAGITPQDEHIARLLREQKLGDDTPKADRSGQVPVHVVATKCDGPKWEAHGYELAALGFGEPMLVSAMNNYMRRDFTDRLYRLAKALPIADGPEQPPADMLLAVVGKRNAGKSTLVNTLAGGPRVIVSEIAGTTRDAVDVHVELDGRSLTVIDTAGLRKKKSFADQIEWYAFDRAQRSIHRSDVVLLLIDATERVSQVDEQLAALVVKSHKPVAIVVNKWDEVDGQVGPNGKPVTVEVYEKYIRKTLNGLAFAPIAFMSAKDGLNVPETVRLAFDLLEQSRARVGTGVLNRLMERIMSQRGPSSKLGTQAKILYVAQVAEHPPTIALVVNRPELFTSNYQRYLLNRFREELPFPEVPIRLVIRSRKRARLGDLLKGKPDDEAILEDLGDDAAAYFDED